MPFLCLRLVTFFYDDDDDDDEVKNWRRTIAALVGFHLYDFLNYCRCSPTHCLQDFNAN